MSAVVLLLVAVAATVGAWVTYDEARALQERGVRASAVVLDVHRGRGSSSYVTVRFVDESGREQTVDVVSYRWSPEPRVGDTPVVLYDPQDPSTIADARIGPDVLPSGLFTAGAVTAGVLAWVTWTRRLDWSRLRWLTP